MNTRLIRTAVAAALTLAAAAPDAQAQLPIPRPVVVGLGAGGTVPTGDLGTFSEPGFNVGGFVQFRPPLSVVGVRGELQYHRNNFKQSWLDDLGVPPGTTAHWGTLYLGAAAVMETMPPGSPIGWFLVLGGGMYDIKVTGSDGTMSASSEGVTKLGFNGGAGLRLRVGAASLYVESRYHHVPTDGETFTFVPVMFGVVF
jgi:hypothetical protein